MVTSWSRAVLSMTPTLEISPMMLPIDMAITRNP